MNDELKVKALRLQAERERARLAVIDAELVFDDLTEQCKRAWAAYHKAQDKAHAKPSYR